MQFLSKSERAFLASVSRLAYCNPFLPERIACERAALGTEYVEGEPVWSLPVDQPERPRANVWKIVARLEPLAEQLRVRLREGAHAGPEALVLYEDVILHLLYQRYSARFFAAAGAGRWRFYQEYLGDWARFLQIDRVPFPSRHDPRHLFACFRQIQRAFEQIFRD